MRVWRISHVRVSPKRKWEIYHSEIYHMFARRWVQHNNRNKREASALVRMWTAHTSLTYSLRQPDEGVVALASACLPVL